MAPPLAGLLPATSSSAASQASTCFNAPHAGGYCRAVLCAISGTIILFQRPTYSGAIAGDRVGAVAVKPVDVSTPHQRWGYCRILGHLQKFEALLSFQRPTSGGAIAGLGSKRSKPFGDQFQRPTSGGAIAGQRLCSTLRTSGTVSTPHPRWGYCRIAAAYRPKNQKPFQRPTSGGAIAGPARPAGPRPLRARFNAPPAVGLLPEPSQRSRSNKRSKLPLRALCDSAIHNP